MPRRRNLQQIEKDAQAADLYRRGLTYQQIADRLGYKNKCSAYEAVWRSAKDTTGEAREDVRKILLDRLQDYRLVAYKALTTKHLIVNNGHIITDPATGEPLIDVEPVLKALDRLIKLDDQEARLRDLYPAAKARVEVITEDTVEAEIKRLEDQLGIPAETRKALTATVVPAEILNDQAGS